MLNFLNNHLLDSLNKTDIMNAKRQNHYKSAK